MSEFKKMKYVANGIYPTHCRICGKNIRTNEPRLWTHVAGGGKVVSIAIHIHHLNDKEKRELVIEVL
jgi:hypothetical protein